MRLILILPFVFSCITAFSQKGNYSSISLSTTQKNNLLATAYTQAELDTLLAQDTAKYNRVVYYYTQSFIVEQNNDCTKCKGFDGTNFSIYAYEQERKKSERVIINFAELGYRIVLLSKSEMTSTLPVFKTAFYNNLRDQ